VTSRPGVRHGLCYTYINVRMRKLTDNGVRTGGINYTYIELIECGLREGSAGINKLCDRNSIDVK